MGFVRRYSAVDWCTAAGSWCGWPQVWKEGMGEWRPIVFGLSLSGHSCAHSADLLSAGLVEPSVYCTAAMHCRLACERPPPPTPLQLCGVSPRLLAKRQAVNAKRMSLKVTAYNACTSGWYVLLTKACFHH